MGLKKRFLKEKVSFLQESGTSRFTQKESLSKTQEEGNVFEFPLMYRSEEHFNLAYTIYEDFIQRIKPDESITPRKIKEALGELLNFYSIDNPTFKEEVIRFVIASVIGYGPLTLIMEQMGEGLNDIIVNTKDYIDVIYDGKTIITPYRFKSEEELRLIINRMLAYSNRKVDESNPIVSAKLPDGSRFEVQIPPIAANLDADGKPGSYVTIRKFRQIPFLFENLIDSGQIDLKIAYFILKAIEGKLNIVISGGTSSGKTTFLNSVTRFIDELDQLIIIEDTKEIRPQMPCRAVRSFETRVANIEGKGEITTAQLLRTALRSSPRRIIVGECRGPEIVVMLNAMNTGHPGSMTTIHADDTKEAIVRIENMYLEARPTANIHFIRSQIVSAIDLVIQLERFADGKRRVVKVSELEKRIEDSGMISILDIFEYQRFHKEDDIGDSSGAHKVLATPLRSIQKMERSGVFIDKRVFQPDFEVSKKMLINELLRYPPSRMCGWKDDFMGKIIKDTFINGQSIVDRWPNLKG